ncbi:MAG: acyl-CoA thioesterase [Candidatus Marinimicrobia bacterium]|jgi:acyl-CoA thioesterase YciA|nr:acyl-CoA thioesterase [Candidatus Neomarinimicrobiota bacterium]MBT5355038.1 acyl-CoA thioesterase [Candidatus Neomarinimicrobiota bacterium]MBT6737237.1 acyl-CoA thioesterase [Candidatus Neomarinimicrobiota bacterium]
MPQDTNIIGTLFGGKMISWMDIAAAKVAHRCLKDVTADTIVTRAMESIEFQEAVQMGEWVNLKSNVIAVGKTSFKIKVEAYAERIGEEKRLACSGIFIMVSVCKNEDGSFKSVEHGISLK